MINYFKYDILEQRLKQIKNDVDNLCSVVDQLEYENISSSVAKKHSSIEDSTSYHTAFSGSNSSLDSFFSALENIGDPDDNDLSSNANQVFKKSVSFSNHVTVLQVIQRRSQKESVKSKICNIKNKLKDYIGREKFYLRYKWQKLKRKKRDDKSKEEFEGKSDKSKVIETLEDNTKVSENIINSELKNDVNLKALPRKFDIDHSDQRIVPTFYSQKRSILKPQTTLRHPIDIVNEEVHVKEKSSEVIKQNIISKRARPIEPRPIDDNKNTVKATTFNGDILFKYLISKAHYPIQLKIAQSIVKLNLPTWYQSSLIV